MGPIASHDEQTAHSRIPAIVAAGVSLAIFGMGLALSAQIQTMVDSGGVAPSWWPRLLSAAGLALSAVLLILAIRGKANPSDEVRPPTRAGLVRVVISAAMAMGLLVLWPLLGFYVVTPVVIVALLLGYGMRSVKGIIIYTALVVGLIYLIFSAVLRVPL